MKKINVLISAHEFSPNQGSECAVGWNFVMNLAKDKDLNLFVLFAEGPAGWPLTYLNAVNSYAKEFGLPSNINLIPISQPKLANLIFKFNIFLFKKMGGMGIPLLHYLGYTLWQKKAFKLSKDISKINKIDITHNLTQISFREPGFLWKLDIPFVWGPIGGTDNVPSEILKDLPFDIHLMEIIRNTANYYQFNFKIRVKKAFKKAKQIYVISNEGLVKISKVNDNVTSLLDSATSINEESNIRKLNEGEKLKIVWAGGLVVLKSLNILIEAFSNINDVNDKVELTVLGDGPLMGHYKNIVNALSLECIKFKGRVPHKEVKSYLLHSHILIHTSYREGTPNIINEALSSGLPIICHDISGMAIAVTENCGIKIPLINFKSSIAGFGNAIENLLSHTSLIEKLSRGAILRRNDLTWGNSAKKISSDYKKILNIKY